jgi:1,4-alpha-glucan branching enzyme
MSSQTTATGPDAGRSQIAADPHELALLLGGDHPEPHRTLGAHPATVGGAHGAVVRAFHPDAVAVECLPEQGEPVRMQPVADRGLFATFLPGASLPMAYRLRFHFRTGALWERDDPYRFLPTLGQMDLHLFNEGTHRRLWEKLGSHRRRVAGVEGVAFAVWAPNARRVSVVGDFCRWDGRLFPMRRLGASGVFELFVPGVSSGAIYKYEIKTREGLLRLKTDPFAFAMEAPPGNASRVVSSSYVWGDTEWMAARPARDPVREPMAIYEVHLGSWARLVEESNRPLTYRELAPRLAKHMQDLGFTHVELLPVAEHPFYGSWGYQVTGYFAPTSRYGTPDDFRFLVDTLHQAGIGVILDWVPAHFPKDDYALRRFDGTAVYEHEDPRLGEHPDWGTLIFNYARHEVRNFLIANALYWLDELHIDGLRVDAVASMLYLDYGRKAGQWVPNRLGGRENLGAVELLQQLNETVRLELPGCFMVAEESTSWPGVTHPVDKGGLGFTFKWNMGWMHDTLKYFQTDPLYRKWHHDQLTFAVMYEWSERFIMPLSHDEVVHLKKSLVEKMPGDFWRKLANLRLLLAYQWTRPGKKLLFMGAEIAQAREWNHDVSLDWHLAREPQRRAFMAYFTELGRLYREHPCLWRSDADPRGFEWIDCSDKTSSVISYVRRDLQGDDLLVIVLNLTPVPREDYRIGAPVAGLYVERLSSDHGFSAFKTHPSVRTEPQPWQGREQSMRLRLPPLGALVLELSQEDRSRRAAERRRRQEAQNAEQQRQREEAARREPPVRLIALDEAMEQRNRSLQTPGMERPPAPVPPADFGASVERAPRFIDMGPEPPPGPEPPGGSAEQGAGRDPAGPGSRKNGSRRRKRR